MAPLFKLERSKSFQIAEASLVAASAIQALRHQKNSAINVLSFFYVLAKGFWVHIFFLCVCLMNPVTTSAAEIVYLAEQRYAGLTELFLGDTDNPGKNIQLNKPIPRISNGRFSNGVSSFSISPDGTLVAFSGDQTIVGDNDIYLVDIAKPDHWVRVGNLPAGRHELRSKFSPDGSKLAFTASNEGYGNVQLYLVDLADPAAAIRINGELAQNGSVSMTGFQFTPDGSHVVYTAGELEAKYELYAVDISKPGESARLNAPGGSVGDSYEGRFQILPDSQRIIYSAVWQNPGVRELHIVSLDQPGKPTTLNAPLQTAGYVFDFEVSPNGKYVSYTADQITDSKREVFVVETTKPGLATKISGAVQRSAGLAQFTPDSRRVMYLGDEERNGGEYDLYSVSIESSSDRIRVNAQLGESDSVRAFVQSPDGSQVAYLPRPAEGFATELMLVNLNNAGAAVKLNGPLPDGFIELMGFDHSGELIAFIAGESVAESQQELFFSKIKSPGKSIRLNEPLPPGGIIPPSPHSFEFVPDATSFLLNAGLNDAWYNPATDGQGFLVTVFPVIRQMFLAWFTYDTVRPPDGVHAVLGEPGHRWLTAQGPYAGDTASLTIYLTEGGVFDAADPPAHNDGIGDGTITVEFADCTEGLVTYDLAEPIVSGQIPIQRLVNDNVALCEALSGQ